MKYFSRFGTCPGFNPDGSRRASAWSGDDLIDATKTVWLYVITSQSLQTPVSANLKGAEVNFSQLQMPSRGTVAPTPSCDTASTFRRYPALSSLLLRQLSSALLPCLLFAVSRFSAFDVVQPVQGPSCALPDGPAPVVDRSLLFALCQLWPQLPSSIRVISSGQIRVSHVTCRARSRSSQP